MLNISLTQNSKIKFWLIHIYIEAFKWTSRLFLSHIAIHVCVKVAKRIDCRLWWHPCSHGNLCASPHAGCVSRLQECWWTSERVRQMKPPPPPPLLFSCMIACFPSDSASHVSMRSCVLHVVSHWVTGRVLTGVLLSFGLPRLQPVYVFWGIHCDEWLPRALLQSTSFDQAPVCLIGLHNHHLKQTKLCQHRMDSSSPQMQKVDRRAVHCRFPIQSNPLFCSWHKRVFAKYQHLNTG